MRIGIIGSGIAGLSAAWFLKNAGHQVTLIEKLDRPGMSAHCIELTIDDIIVGGDVPSRMFNEAQWPNLLQLYREIGVAFQAVDASHSFSNLAGDNYLKLNLPYRFNDLTQVIHQPARRILLDMKRLRTDGGRALADGMPDSITLKTYLRESRYSSEFVFKFLYPILSSTVCTCSYASLDEYPAALILSAIQNISVGQSLLKTKFGTNDVSRRLSENVELQIESQVEQISERGDAVEVIYKNGQAHQFDHVVIATQANQAARFSGVGADPITDMLSGFEYENVTIVVHRDPRLMPVDQKDWATFNMISNESSAMCTVWMNRFHTDWNLNVPVFQTINPIIEPADELVDRRIVLQRPVVSPATKHRLESLRKYHDQANRRIWYCGSYASTGIPLLETAVVSAKTIADKMSQLVLQ